MSELSVCLLFVCSPRSLLQKYIKTGYIPLHHRERRVLNLQTGSFKESLRFCLLN